AFLDLYLSGQRITLFRSRMHLSQAVALSLVKVVKLRSDFVPLSPVFGICDLFGLGQLLQARTHCNLTGFHHRRTSISELLRLIINVSELALVVVLYALSLRAGICSIEPLYRFRFSVRVASLSRFCPLDRPKIP